MSKKFGTQRKRAFLTYLRQSGNQTLSAERAKVSRSWVCLHRQTDAGFNAACLEAVRQAQDRLIAVARPSTSLGTNGSGSVDPRWRYHGGHELVVEGTGGSCGRRVQLRRARLSQWTVRVEQRFLAVLAGTCNVRLACRELGLWPPSAYNHRQRFPGFARAWDEAVEIGRMELESDIQENFAHFFDRELPEPAVVMRDISVREAIRLVRLYDRRERERRSGR